jgi:hypothetical protein
MLENTERAITNGQSRETYNIWQDNPEKLTTYDKTNKDKTKTQHNMWWTPLYVNKHK